MRLLASLPWRGFSLHVYHNRSEIGGVYLSGSAGPVESGPICFAETNAEMASLVASTVFCGCQQCRRLSIRELGELS